MRTQRRGGPLSAVRNVWLSGRDRLVRSARFRRWASAFPLTRPMVRRRATALFDLCAGFVYTQVLTACIDLKLFERLAEEPATAATLAEELRLPEPAMLRLLEAACALTLISRRGRGRYGLGGLGAATLGDPGIAAMVTHHKLLYRDLSDPVQLLAGTVAEPALAAFWSYAGDRDAADLAPDQVAAYSELMERSQAMVRTELLSAYRFGKHDTVLDIGGGEGGFVRLLAARFPALKLQLFDLPAVAERAKERARAARLSSRIDSIGGDFLTSPLPHGADIVILVRVLFDHDDATVAALLQRVFSLLPDGGVILIAEPFARSAGLERISDAYFGLYLLAMGGGRTRSKAELKRLLTQAGFERIREHRTRQPMVARVLTARKQLRPEV
ncbi:MAG: methyltransferase [Rhodothalassiaceae bacterium]